MSGPTYASQVGVRLRNRRKLLGLTQEEVADLAGTSQRSVSMAEHGKAGGLELYAAIAEVLGLTLTVLPHDAITGLSSPSDEASR